MAFPPSVDVSSGRVYAFEALVRGPNNEGAGSILAQVTEANQYAFDQACRVKAITVAQRLGLETGAMLSINFMPGAVYSPAACIQLTLKTARSTGFPLDRLIFGVTEAEEVVDRGHLVRIVGEYRKHGFRMAMDDFGAGYSGLNLLAEFRAEILKLDMDLTRDLQAANGARDRSVDGGALPDARHGAGGGGCGDGERVCCAARVRDPADAGVSAGEARV